MCLRHCSPRAFLLGAGALLWASIGEAQTTPDLYLVSPYQDGTYEDLQVDAQGRLHAVWLAEPTDALFPDLLYSSSTDGRTWSAPVQVVEGNPGGPLGIPQLVVDGTGRVFAFWTVLAAGISGMDTEEMPDRPRFTTLHYRVLEGGRWSPIVQVGQARSVLSWSASLGANGEVSVLWSEIPGPANMLTSLEEAGVIKVAAVSGPRPGPARTVLDSRGTGGFWGVTGYVDGRGAARGYALRRTDSPTLVRFGGASVSPGLELGTMLRGYNGHRLPKLVLDEAGQEHFLLYNGDAGNPAILDYAGGGEPRTILRAPAGRILSYQATRTLRGSVTVTAAVQPRGGQTADLYVVEYDAGRWGEPRNVTYNARRNGAGGVWSTTGTTYGTTATWNAIGGAAVVAGTGRVGVLLTNRLSGGAGTDQQTVGSREYVFFAWAGEGTGRVVGAPPSTQPAPTPAPGGPAAPAPMPTLPGGQTPSPAPPAPPRVPTPQPAPTPTAETPARPQPRLPAPEPAPAPPAPSPERAAGLPVGTYTCHYVSPYAGPIPTGETVIILAGGRYQGLTGDVGTYELRSGTPRWTSGGLSRASPAPEFYETNEGQPALKVTKAAGSADPSDTLHCVLR